LRCGSQLLARLPALPGLQGTTCNLADKQLALQEDNTAYTVKCNIDTEVNNLTEGIKLALKDDREKNSEKLGRLAVFTGSSAITKLSPYMTLQMVRFFYKVQAAQKAKILRKVPACETLCHTQAKVGPVTPAQVTAANRRISQLLQWIAGSCS